MSNFTEHVSTSDDNFGLILLGAWLEPRVRHLGPTSLNTLLFLLCLSTRKIESDKLLTMVLGCWCACDNGKSQNKCDKTKIVGLPW